MNKAAIKACRDRQIHKLAARKDGDEASARSIYNRCVRFCLRYFRWGEVQANGGGHYTNRQWSEHEHEHDLIKGIYERLSHELNGYGLEFEFPGLYPILVDENGSSPIELFWY